LLEEEEEEDEEEEQQLLLQASRHNRADVPVETLKHQHFCTHPSTNQTGMAIGRIRTRH